MSENVADCGAHSRPQDWYYSAGKPNVASWTTSRFERIRAFGHRSRDARIERVFRRRYRSGATMPVEVPDTERAFHSLVGEWRAETQFASMGIQAFLHPSYQRIIGLGPRVIPMILGELQRQPEHWFWALAALTGENPVAPLEAGNVRAMTTAWLLWGQRRGYL